MTAEVWLERLSALLSAEGLGGAEWADGERRGVRLRMEEGQPLAAVSRLRQCPTLMRHLEAWSGPALPITLVGQGGGPGPHLLLQASAVLVFCGESGVGEVVTADSVEGWFRGVFGMAPPFEDPERELRCVAGNVWAGPGVQASALTGLPWGLIAGEGRYGRYRIVAFAGYGINSWACYFTDVRPGIAVKLRLPFGGFYMDPVRCREGIERTIRAATDLAEEAERLGVALDCESEMADTRVQVTDIRGSWELGGRLWDPLVEALGRLRAG